MDARPRLLDRVRDHLRKLDYSHRTEQQYLSWIRRFILFHGKRHPSDMAAREVELPWLVGNLLYGAGLLLGKALQLRVKNILFEYRQVIVRSAKGANAVQSPLDQ
jgi:Phage integrase, N-terminal SAM-like domain